MTTWTKLPKASGTSWTTVPDADIGLTTGGSPIGLLLALTYANTLGTHWTKLPKASGTVWTNIPKP